MRLAIEGQYFAIAPYAACIQRIVAFAPFAPQLSPGRGVRRSRIVRHFKQATAGRQA